MCAYVHARLHAIARLQRDWFKRLTAWPIANHRRPSSQSTDINSNCVFTNSTLLDSSPAMASSERASIPPQPFITVKQPQPQEEENTIQPCAECDLCGKEFSSKIRLRAHFIRNHPTWKYCKRPSKTQSSLNKSVHQGNERKEIIYIQSNAECQLCFKIFPNLTKLRGHFVRDHLAFRCPIP